MNDFLSCGQKYNLANHSDRALTIARAIISGEMGIILGCRELLQYAFKAEWEEDDDLNTIKGIESETDEFPVDEDRKLWNENALKEKDKEIEQFENFYRELVISAVKNLVNRYGIDS